MPQPVTNAVYDTWDAWRTRVSVPGIIMLPTAGRPPQPSVPVMLNGGMEMEELVFVAERYGAEPIIPQPWTQNSNRLFLGGGQSAAFPVGAQGGYSLYRVIGVYLWAILNPEGLESTFMLGAGPFPGFTASSESLPANYQNPNLMNWLPAEQLQQQHSQLDFDGINRYW